MQLADLSGLMLLRRFVNVASHIPGRIRLQFTSNLVAGLSKSKLSTLEKYCSPEGCLQSCSLNAGTNSLLLEYKPDLLAPALLDTLFGKDDNAAEQALEQLYHLLSH